MSLFAESSRGFCCITGCRFKLMWRCRLIIGPFISSSSMSTCFLEFYIDQCFVDFVCFKWLGGLHRCLKATKGNKPVMHSCFSLQQGETGWVQKQASLIWSQSPWCLPAIRPVWFEIWPSRCVQNKTENPLHYMVAYLCMMQQNTDMMCYVRGYTRLAVCCLSLRSTGLKYLAMYWWDVLSMFKRMQWLRTESLPVAITCRHVMIICHAPLHACMLLDYV